MPFASLTGLRMIGSRRASAATSPLVVLGLFVGQQFSPSIVQMQITDFRRDAVSSGFVDYPLMVTAVVTV
jgi:hypothetical protein